MALSAYERAITIGEALELLRREVRVEEPGPANSRIILPNGWVVSVGCSYIHNCANHAMPDDDPVELALSLLNGTRDWTQTPNCEVAIFASDGTWFEPHGSGPAWFDVPADRLLAMVDAVGLYRDGGPCPCPDCVCEPRVD